MSRVKRKIANFKNNRLDIDKNLSVSFPFILPRFICLLPSLESFETQRREVKEAYEKVGRLVRPPVPTLFPFLFFVLILQQPFSAKNVSNVYGIRGYGAYGAFRKARSNGSMVESDWETGRMDAGMRRAGHTSTLHYRFTTTTPCTVAATFPTRQNAPRLSPCLVYPRLPTRRNSKMWWIRRDLTKDRASYESPVEALWCQARGIESEIEWMEKIPGIRGVRERWK